MDGHAMTLRELTPFEAALVSGGEFTWGELAGHMLLGAGVGAMVGSTAAGVGAGPGAVAGFLIGGIEYSFGQLIDFCF